jgi:hypothetical protein
VNAGIYVCRFAFCGVPLTGAEAEAFQDGLGLPRGAGYTPASVTFSYRPPGGEPTPADPVEDAVGAYHVNLEATSRGLYTWEAQALNAEADLIASTGVQIIQIGPIGP